MVLVDNAPYSYLLQLENGIPILPYYTGEDTELVHLEKYLEEMSRCMDVREFNKNHFQLHRYADCNDAEEVVREIMQNKTLL
jgi:CTD small phosphatase-like protein 2